MVPTSRAPAHLHEVEGIERIRFLTSHPNYFDDDLITPSPNFRA
jgi:tRNA A37 methylthiotransferase MiaB